MQLFRSGRRDDAIPLCREEMLADADWLGDLVSTAMEASELELAGESAAVYAALRWGSRWYPRSSSGFVPLPPPWPPVRQATAPKLRHDIEQFRYLLERDVLSDEFESVIRDYERVVARLETCGSQAAVRLDPEEEAAVGHVYNRIVHIRSTPRVVGSALSTAWDPHEVERQYLEQAPGIVVVDDFVSVQALADLRAFCLESTVWSANRYAHGRLGAFFRDGFNCPLLLQVAEELRRALPRVIGDRYPLRQLWGFKNGTHLPGDSTVHADFAAVNVNFWLTPENANLDENSGGLVIYDVDAPLSWDFDIYNGNGDVIVPFLQRQQSRAITIPYRQNRAIIFNSDLFHGTAELRFRPGYENRRINVTMLYGDRERDVHHPRLARPDPMGDLTTASVAPWRSWAFARSRRASGRRRRG